MKELNITGGIEAILNGRIVKSVQRGHVVGEVGDEHEINVPISTIEIDKSILICSFDEEHEYQYTMYPILSSNKITLKSDNFFGNWGFTDVNFNWQVIEFY